MAELQKSDIEALGSAAGQAQETTPDHIMQVALGFMPAKTLLSAVELGLFTALEGQALTGEALCAELDLHPRANPDFFDALTALGVLERDGDGPTARYRNTAASSRYLKADSPDYIGGFLLMSNERLYPFWGRLSEGLRTGKPQNEIATLGKPLFDALYADPERMGLFLEGMSGISRSRFLALAERYDFSRHKRLCDVGGALGLLALTVAERYPDLQAVSADIDVVTPHARRKIEGAGFSGRVQAVDLDMFTDPLPRCDVMTMSMILHDWNLEKKKLLIAKAYEALEPGGAFIAIDHMIDDARRQNVPGLMISLTMLIETGDGFDYTAADFFGWCEEAGFRRGEVIPLGGGGSAAVAYKPEG